MNLDYLAAESRKPQPERGTFKRFANWFLERRNPRSMTSEIRCPRCGWEDLWSVKDDYPPTACPSCGYDDSIRDQESPAGDSLAAASVTAPHPSCEHRRNPALEKPSYKEFQAFLNAVARMAIDDWALDPALVRNRIDYWSRDDRGQLEGYLRKCSTDDGCTESDVVEVAGWIKRSIDSNTPWPVR